jgi:hypothetical protein
MQRVELEYKHKRDHMYIIGETKKTSRQLFFHCERDGEKLCSTKCMLTDKLDQILCGPSDYKASISMETPSLEGHSAYVKFLLLAQTTIEFSLK